MKSFAFGMILGILLAPLAVTLALAAFSTVSTPLVKVEWVADDFSDYGKRDMRENDSRRAVRAVDEVIARRNAQGWSVHRVVTDSLAGYDVGSVLFVRRTPWYATVALPREAGGRP